jgi:hypothetical protein
MGKIWTAFASGETMPWEEYKVAERFMRFGPEGGISMQSLEPDKGREYK